jgi:hypothetical protein
LVKPDELAATLMAIRGTGGDAEDPDEDYLLVECAASRTVDGGCAAGRTLGC